jgi:hypothetical protein
MRRALCAVIVLAVACLNCGPAEALLGGEWLRLDEPAQSRYIAGAMDAWNTVVAQLAKRQLTNEIGYRVMASVVTCASSRAMTPKQISATAQQYIRANPDLRQSDMVDVLFASVRDACKKG